MASGEKKLFGSSELVEGFAGPGTNTLEIAAMPAIVGFKNFCQRVVITTSGTHATAVRATITYTFGGVLQTIGIQLPTTFPSKTGTLVLDFAPNHIEGDVGTAITLSLPALGAAGIGEVSLMGFRERMFPVQPIIPPQDNLFVDLDASLIGDGVNNVSQQLWGDSGPASRVLLQVTGANQPLFIVNGLNNLSILRFDGVNTKMPGFMPTLAQPLTIVAVAKASQTVALATLFGSRDTNPCELEQAAAGNWQLSAGATLVSSKAADTVPHVFTCLFNGANSTLRVDGVQVAAGNAGANALTNGMRVGSNQANANPFNGDLAEIVVYAGILPNWQQSQIEQYLAKKWNVSVIG